MTLHEQYKEDIKGSTRMIQLYIRQSYLNSIDSMIEAINEWNNLIPKNSSEVLIESPMNNHLKQQRNLIANQD